MCFVLFRFFRFFFLRLFSQSQKDTLIARARTAKTTTKVNDMLGSITGTTSMDAFERMEEKVEALEAGAEVRPVRYFFGLAHDHQCTLL